MPVYWTVTTNRGKRAVSGGQTVSPDGGIWWRSGGVWFGVLQNKRRAGRTRGGRRSETARGVETVAGQNTAMCGMCVAASPDASLTNFYDPAIHNLLHFLNVFHIFVYVRTRSHSFAHCCACSHIVFLHFRDYLHTFVHFLIISHKLCSKSSKISQDLTSSQKTSKDRTKLHICFTCVLNIFF